MVHLQPGAVWSVEYPLLVKLQDQTPQYNVYSELGIKISEDCRYTLNAVEVASTATETGPSLATATSISSSLPCSMILLPLMLTTAPSLTKAHDDSCTHTYTQYQGSCQQTDY